MIVKTFEGSSIRDAIAAVKKEFGHDAVILTTNEKQMDENGLRVFEVKAAAPEKKIVRPGGRSTDITDSLNDSRVKAMMHKLEKIEGRLLKQSEVVATKTGIQNIEGGIQELKFLILDALKRKEGSSIEGLPDYLIPIERKLRINGLGEAHIAKLINHLNQIPKPDEPTLASFEGIDDYYNAQAIKWMIKKIHIEPRWTLLEGSNSIHAFVGPCGSGKTAAICKIAAHYKREEKCKVLLVSYDNSRLAAQEQLRVYAKVLGSPFASINEASELEGVLLEHRECDLILIDTAGRYPKHDNQISDLKDLSKSNLPIDFHMVLSVTEKEEHSNRAIRGFSPIGLQSIIFSKLDESWTFGEIFNLSQKWTLPLSFFTTGQKVPDDIERACRERVIERIFGL